MFYKELTGDKTFTAILAFAYVLILWLPEFIYPGNIAFTVPADSTPLYLWISGLTGNNNEAPVAVSFLLVLGLSVLLITINTKYILSQQRTFLPAMMMMLLTSSIPGTHTLSAPLIASFFIVFACDYLLSSYKAEPNSYNFFLAGLMLGIGSLTYAPVLYFLCLTWISILLYRPFYWREFVFPVLGYLVPFVFQISWLILNDNNFFIFLDSFKSQLFSGWTGLSAGPLQRIFIIYMLVLVIISSIFMLQVFPIRKIYIRRYYQVFFIYFAIALFILLFVSGSDHGFIYILSVPVVFLLTHYFITSRERMINRVMLYVSLAASIILMVVRFYSFFT